MASSSALLSQYEILLTLCCYLSSADIIHLATTSKEHRDYITSSGARLKSLLSRALCDGSGIDARASLMRDKARLIVGENKLPVDKPCSGAVYDRSGGQLHEIVLPDQCLGADAKPCSECGAQVCDNCRFHFFYSARDVEEYLVESCEDGVFPPKSASDPYMSEPLFSHLYRMFGVRDRVFCYECHPKPLPGRFEWCTCSFFDHFVGERWLCFACLRAEEARLEVDRHNFLEGICDCGKPAMDKSNEGCRVCKRARGIDTTNELKADDETEGDSEGDSDGDEENDHGDNEGNDEDGDDGAREDSDGESNDHEDVVSE